MQPSDLLDRSAWFATSPSWRGSATISETFFAVISHRAGSPSSHSRMGKRWRKKFFAARRSAFLQLFTVTNGGSFLPCERHPDFLIRLGNGGRTRSRTTSCTFTSIFRDDQFISVSPAHTRVPDNARVTLRFASVRQTAFCFETASVSNFKINRVVEIGGWSR